MSERVLTRRELNRALLARQLLLDRTKLPVPRAVERLGGLQAQHTSSPYLQLWARLAGFEREQLTRALERRKLVKALLMRGTLHLVTPADYWAFATVRREIGGTALATGLREARAAGAPPEARGRSARGLRGENRTLKEMLALLKPRPPTGHAGVSLEAAPGLRLRGARAAVRHLGLPRDGVYAPADEWIPGESAADRRRSTASSVATWRRSGATRHDIGQWAGIPRLTPIGEASRAARPAHVPRRERPRSTTCRALRYRIQTRLYSFDSCRGSTISSSHADRTRILGDVPVTRIVTKTRSSTRRSSSTASSPEPGSSRRGASRPFGRLARVGAALAEEAARLEEFVAD